MAVTQQQRQRKACGKALLLQPRLVPPVHEEGAVTLCDTNHLQQKELILFVPNPSFGGRASTKHLWFSPFLPRFVFIFILVKPGGQVRGSSCKMW